MRILQAFTSNAHGNVAMMFGLTLIPILLSVGMAIDGWRANVMRTEISEALDASLLAGARKRTLNPAMTPAQVEQFTEDFFLSNIDQNAANVSSFAFNFDDTTDTFTVDLTGDIDSIFMRLIGQDKMDMNLTAQARMTPPRALEIVLALDNTDSMIGAKLTDLKSATTDLVNAVMSPTTNSVKVGIVPFAQYVNVGTGVRSESWIDVPADYTDHWTHCRDTYPDRAPTGETETRQVKEKYNCRDVPSTCTRDGYSYPCTKRVCDERWVDKEFPLYDNGDPVEVCEPRSRAHVWRGCVGSRNTPLDVEDRDFAASPVPGLLDISCAKQLLPLTDNKADVLAKVNSMSTAGSTYIPAGLSWAYRLLSSDAPYTQAKTYAEVQAADGKKALILMTDGINTKSANYPNHNGTNRAAADAVTESLCTEAKDKDIEIYTVAFLVTDTNIKNLLRDCASEPDNFFDATDSAALSASFMSIVNELTQLSLVK